MSDKPQVDDTISLPEAARRLGVTRQHLSHLAIKGLFPATNVYGLWRVKESDVQAAEAGKAKGRAPVTSERPQ